VVGRNAYFTVEGTRHYTNLFVVLVGRTSESRKGTTHDRVKQLLNLVNSDWVKNNCTSGLSTGEGLIHAVRDASDGPNGCDLGVTDKRLLVVESEFAIVFKQFNRQGNILSTTIRQAWDSGDLGNLSKGSPERATGAHISILAHITPEELRRSMSDTEAANGFGNRFIWVHVKRSKHLAFGGDLKDEELQPLAERIKTALASAETAGEIGFDDDCRKLWKERYPSLNQGCDGLVGALTSRAPAQVRRLAIIYALLDQSRVVRVEHLRAALAFWSYAELSAKAIFGDSLGDPVVDTILDSLRNNPGGLTRTEIHSLLGRNRGAREIDRAFKILTEHGFARSRTEETQGRSCERWFAVSQSDEPGRESYTRKPSTDEDSSYISFNSYFGKGGKRDETTSTSIEKFIAEAPMLVKKPSDEIDKLAEEEAA
jgi:Protein of unknown function (DUF3987)